MKKILVVAPHPDDETLGLGGTLFKYNRKNYELFWLIVTSMKNKDGFPDQKILKREEEIENIKKLYNFSEVFKLNLSPSKLDLIPMHELVKLIGEVFKKAMPEIVFIPNSSDIHSDHQIVHQASIACSKWFRFPSIKKLLSYETLSETDIFPNNTNVFCPNYFVDIDDSLDNKIEAMKIYEDEIADFPFPRSEEAIRSLAKVRGAASGFKAAEAFMLLKEIVS